MADYSSGPGSGEDNFSDAGEMESAPAKREESDEMGKTTLVPKSICPGMEFKPGEEMVLRVKRVMETDYEMEYAPDSGKEEKGEAASTEAEGSRSGESEMTGMMY